MRCRRCGTEIADKAIVCYRCGTATTEAKFKPAPVSRGRPSRWIVLAFVLAAMLGLLALALLRP